MGLEDRPEGGEAGANDGGAGFDNGPDDDVGDGVYGRRRREISIFFGLMFVELVRSGLTG